MTFANEIRYQRFTKRMKKIFSGNQLQIVIREAGSDDPVFFEKLYLATRRNEFAGLGWNEDQIRMLLKMQFDAQTQGYRAQFPDLRKFVIEANETAVGRLLLTDEIRVVDIALMAASRNLGIGSFVLNCLLDKAVGENKDVFLQVLKTNDAARGLYERFKFETIGEDDLYLTMRRSLPKKIIHTEEENRSYGFAQS